MLNPMNMQDRTALVDRINEYLHDYPHLLRLTGALAPYYGHFVGGFVWYALHGIPERAKDIDIAVTSHDALSFLESYWSGLRLSKDRVLLERHGYPDVDVFVPSALLFRSVSHVPVMLSRFPYSHQQIAMEVAPPDGIPLSMTVQYTNEFLQCLDTKVSVCNPKAGFKSYSIGAQKEEYRERYAKTFGLTFQDKDDNAQALGDIRQL